MIYLDHHAATPLAPAVRAAIARAHELAWANPSSVHAAGRAARALLERARRALADAIHAEPADIVFTAGGTEACNLAIQGLARGKVVGSALEHPAVREQLDVVVADTGVPPLAGCGLLARQWVNHETGELAALAEAARACAKAGVPLFVDACQALGKLPVDVRTLGASAVAFAASKLGGPAGAGALWVARGRDLRPLLRGGPQERGRRAGTPDVATLAGFTAALEAVPARLADMPRLALLRGRLERVCLDLGAVANHRGERVATVTNVSFPGWRSEVLVAALDLEGVCASAGAACSSGVAQASQVLRAMYPDEPWRAESALRLSLGPETTDADVERASEALRAVIARGPGTR